MGYPVFASGDVLTAADMNAVGLWLVKTQTIGTAVTTVNVTGAFSTDYENYKIIVSGGAGSALTALRIQIGAANTGYYGGLVQVAYATAAVTGLNDNNATLFNYAGVSSTNTLFMNVDLISPFLAKNTMIHAAYPAMGTTAAGGNYNGFLNNSTSYTDFTISPASGNITGGTIRVYGYRN